MRGGDVVAARAGSATAPARLPQTPLYAPFSAWLRPAAGAAFHSAEHRPRTYRGGLVADLQRMLPMRADGSFTSQPNP